MSTSPAPGGLPPGVEVAADDTTGVATVEIRRGPDNFFDVEVLSELADGIDELAAGSTRAVVLCSEGRNFCAGADLTGRSGNLARDGAPHLYDVALRLFEQPLPIVAAVQGAAVGGGLGLALAADFRVASPQSRFAANFSLLGLHHGFALTVTLPNAVGQQAALDLLYSGRRIDGETAYRIGLCDHLVPTDQIRSRAVEVATEIAAAAPLAIRAIRATMRSHLAEQARTAMVRERAEQERLAATDDFREGIAAMSDRRTPDFSGR